MSKKDETPECVKNGITFWPIPKFDGDSIALYFDRRKLPFVPRKFIDMADELFFSGGKLPAFAPCVDQKKAHRAIRVLLTSWGPSHESKRATVGYALWLWTTPESLSHQKAA